MGRGAAGRERRCGPGAARPGRRGPAALPAWRGGRRRGGPGADRLGRRGPAVEAAQDGVAPGGDERRPGPGRHGPAAAPVRDRAGRVAGAGAVTALLGSAAGAGQGLDGGGAARKAAAA